MGELPAKGASHPLSQLAFLPSFVIILDEAGNIFWYSCKNLAFSG